MAICMKLSPHICEDSCPPSPSQVSKEGDRGGKSRVTTVIALRVSDEMAAEIKRLAGKSGEGTVNNYLQKIIKWQVMRKR